MNQDFENFWISKCKAIMFEKLMKYPIDIFHRGDFHLGISLPRLILFFFFIALIATSIWAYRTTIARTNRGLRGFLIFLRVGALCTLAFCLLKPFVAIYQTKSDDSYLLLLADSSKSMQITDSVDGESRLKSVSRLLFQPDRGLVNTLSEKFKIRLFTFDAGAKRIGIPAREDSQNTYSHLSFLEAHGEKTDLPASLNEALEDFQEMPLSGVVVFSDGADRSEVDISKVAFRMRDRKIPIHTVGVGLTEEITDIEIVKIDVPRMAEEDSPVEIWTTVKRKGYGERTVNLHLTDENRVVKMLRVNLDKSHLTRRVPIKFIPQNPGTQKYVVHIPAEPDEAIPQNNAKQFLLKVVPNKRVKILFIEGRPRAEFAFIKRALKNDPNIRLTDRCLVDDAHFKGTKGAPNYKFGFYPDSKKVLFDYDAVIFGNIAASQFTKEQLENTVEFVRTRGGGFLMLGGSESLSNPRMADAYINTPIARMLPVELELGLPPLPTRMKSQFSGLPQRNMERRDEGFMLQLTSAGKTDSLMALADDPLKNANRWSELPPLIGYSKVKRAKAGATVIAVHPTDRNEFGSRVLIATHNYNAGRVKIFTPHSSWRWKMFTPTDGDLHESHERFWRQTAKWLTTTSRDHLKLKIAKTSYSLKEPVIIEATAYDHKFELTNLAKIHAIITDGGGKRKELHLKQVLGKDGWYTARFIAPRREEYRVDVFGTLGGESLGEQHGLFTVGESYAEFTNAELNTELLQTLARISGGEYYTIENASKMANQIPLVESEKSSLVNEGIWDMPVIFGGIILLLGLEWFLRKRRGLV